MNKRKVIKQIFFLIQPLIFTFYTFQNIRNTKTNDFYNIIIQKIQKECSIFQKKRGGPDLKINKELESKLQNHLRSIFPGKEDLR